MKKFRVAIQGIIHALKSEWSLRIHLGAAIIVIQSAWILEVSLTEWTILLLCIVMVIAAELFNTALEWLCNKVEPQHDEKIGQIKDVAAGAVLVITIGAIGIGLIIFLPKVMALFGH